MKTHKVELLIIDFDDVGDEEIQSLLEETRYSNRCIFPKVKKITTVDIGEWHDKYLLNLKNTKDEEYERLFNE